MKYAHLKYIADTLQAENTALREALTDLHAVQNGPPLIRHQAEWEAAMTKTRAALGLKEPEGEQC